MIDAILKEGEGDALQACQDAAGLGILAAALWLVERLKVVLSVPAPREIRTAGPRSRVVPPGTQYYVATTPATPGAPPRKLSGRLRADVGQEETSDKLTVHVGTTVIYGAKHEDGNHPWLMPVIRKYQSELARVLGSNLGGS